ncbi:MAG: thiol-disulfide oxidoreductase DCC [Phycisphaerae bacterium]|nr:thiol-disulfide oxidoreductase DCC [Phycisphaerae bacterium]OUX02735.1 MAG: hypothetical protein CBD91_01845 [Phycisphaeraceae bacterium TMED231]
MSRPAHHSIQPDTSPPTTLFYDGECGLCHRCVAWFLRHDRNSTLRFAPLQGETYAGLERPRPDDLSTMVVLDTRGLRTESDAVLAALHAVGGVWSLVAGLGRMIPRPLRNAVYRYVARRRLGWFGPADACRLPGDGAEDRFLP